MFKNVQEYELTDINLFITDKEQEGQYLEFKSNFEDNKGKCELLSDPAKISISEEIVSFLNSDGGLLIIGVAEEPGSTGRPEKITPIKEVDEKPRKLLHSITMTINPYPHGLETKIIYTGNKSTEGIVLIQVPRSANAPHAVKNKGALKVLVRRDDKKIPIGIREIGDLILRGDIERTQASEKIREFRNSFYEEFSNTGAPNSYKIGFQVLFVPTRSLKLPHLWNIKDSLRQGDAFIWSFESGETIECYAINSGRVNLSNTILRGVVGRVQNDYFNYLTRINRDGVVSSEFISCESKNVENEDCFARMHLSWILGEISNLYYTTEKLKKYTSPGQVEYTISINTRVGDSVGNAKDYKILLQTGRSYHFDDEFLGTSIETPSYFFGNYQEFLIAAAEARNDILCHFGYQGDIKTVTKIVPKVSQS